jgi:hypothetical protein
MRVRAWVAIALGVFVYLTMHFALSRSSARLVQSEWGISDAFLYIPGKPSFVAEHETPWLQIHQTFRWLFYPAWSLDYYLFGGPKPMTNLPMLGTGPR